MAKVLSNMFYNVVSSSLAEQQANDGEKKAKSNKQLT